MIRIPNETLQKIDTVIGKKVEDLLDAVLAETPEEIRGRIRRIYWESRIRSSINAGFEPIPTLEFELRNQLNEKIISLIQQLKLKHWQVAWIIHTARPNVTAIMNRRIENVSADLLVRILAILGVKIKIEFENDVGKV